jgi:hypothetical protein
MIRRDLIRKHNIRFDETLVSNDVGFSTMVGHYMENFRIAEKTIYCATVNPGSLTKILTENVYDIRLDVFLWRYGFLHDNLAKKDFNSMELLHLHTFVKLAEVMSYKLGMKKLRAVFKTMRASGVRIIDLRCLNPVHICRMARIAFREYAFRKKNRRFYVSG